jgi:hypothetical protein
MSHPNAILAPKGRLQLAKCVVDEGWTLQRAAERFQIAVATAACCARRYREHGEAGMTDRSSARFGHRSGYPVTRERRIIGLRVNQRWGPDRIGYRLGIQPSTVHRVLRATDWRNSFALRVGQTQMAGSSHRAHHPSLRTRAPW